MSGPYEVLGIDPSADAAAVRARYLELVRAFPPEQSPEKFSEIRAAYDQLQDPVAVWKNRLFDEKSMDSVASLAAELQPRFRRQRLPTSLLLSLVRS
ncbi:J domain-containing protein [Lignipirellula cremea]|uniref:DnaJ domain protein n=1 Tax=Lignipirellula cremea TaxID=2528010 RepID=A0A518E3S5_9BACT|nr:J domain-containing protein [Lignipirellula cremea]QDU98741.1 DnaJ domain protein [Lignipirellula cremea]